METKYLKTLNTIIETGSFAAAARQLNYSQSTITFQVQQLEQALGIQIFEKIGRKMRLTEAGNRLIPYISDVLLSTDNLFHFKDEDVGYNGNLTVALADSILNYMMRPVLEEFCRTAPNVQLTLLPKNCYEIRENIINGSADIGILYNVGGFGDRCRIKNLMDCPLTIVGPADIDLDKLNLDGTNIRSDICLLIVDKNALYLRILDEYLRKNEIVFTNSMELGSLETVKQCVKCGLGISILPRFLVEDDIADGSMIEIPCKLNGTIISAICSYHKNKIVTPAMQLFMDITAKHLKVNDRAD